MRWLDSITDSMDMSLSKLRELVWTGKPGVLQSMGCKQLDTTDQLNNNNRYSCQIIAKIKKKIFTEMTSKLSFRNVVIHLTQSTINGCFYHLKFTQQKLRMIGPSDSTILFNQLATERIFESQPFDCKAHHTYTSGCLL